MIPGKIDRLYMRVCSSVDRRQRKMLCSTLDVGEGRLFYLFARLIFGIHGVMICMGMEREWDGPGHI